MLIFWFVLTFVIGAVIGSFLNVCIYRIPYEKSLLWPGSHCGHCFRPIPLYDNIPLLSYWLLRGKCRTCKAPFSIRYFVVELGTALAFVGLFYAEVVANYLRIPYLAANHDSILLGDIPSGAWWLFAYHAALLCFLIVTSLCDFDHMEVPLSVTLTGTIVGIIGGTLLPWPYPNAGVKFDEHKAIASGVFHWPVWIPNDWLPAGSWQMGLATSLAGALAGIVLLRGIRAIFGVIRGVEGMGMGDSDLMMMAGSFIGWQPIIVALFLSAFPGLLFGLLQLARKGDHPLPFVPALAIGILLAVFFWPALGEQFRPILFDGGFLGILAVLATVLLVAITFLLRLIRGRG